MVCRKYARFHIALGGRCKNESLVVFSFGTHNHFLRTILYIEYNSMCWKYNRKEYFILYLFSLRKFWCLYSNLPQSALCFGRIGRNFNSQFLHDTFVLFPRFEDQKYPFLGVECTKTEKITKKNVFFRKIFGQFKKKQYLCTRFRKGSKSSVK